MAADRITKEFFFIAESLEPVGFREWHGRLSREIRGGEKIGLSERGGKSAPSVECRVIERSIFPILRRARFSKLVESADADEGFHLFRKRLNAQEEIGQ